MTLDAEELPAVTSEGPLGRTVPRRGRVARLVAALPVPSTLLRRRDDAPAVLTRLYAGAVRGRDVVHVVQLTPADARDVGVELATAGWLVGDTPAYRDVTAGPAPDRAGGPAILGLRTPRIDGAALRVLREASAVVLVVDTARGGERALADAVDLLGGLDVAVAGLVVHDGRIRRGGGPLPARVSQPPP